MKNLKTFTVAILSCFLVLAIHSGAFSMTEAEQKNTNVSSERADSVRTEASNPPQDTNKPITEPSIKPAPDYGYLTQKEFILAVLVTLTTLICMFLIFILLRKSLKLRAESILRVFSVTLIILGTLFIIVSGYRSEQMAPAMGLFGTIAGYVLGKTEKKEMTDNE